MSHVNDNLDDHVNEITSVGEKSKEIEELEPHKEGGNSHDLTNEDGISSGEEFHKGNCSHSINTNGWNQINVIPYRCEIFKWGSDKLFNFVGKEVSGH